MGNGEDEGIYIPQPEDFGEQLIRVSNEMKDLAKSYYEARKKYAKCLNKITVMIYKADLHRCRSAFENKIPMLFANPVFEDEAIKTYSEMTEAKQEYKGLEMVLQAYMSEISGIQSIIKFMQQGEIAEATRNKYAFM